MSVSSKSTFSRSARSSTVHSSTAYPSTAQSTESTGMPVRGAMLNRSPEQAVANRHFEMPLFPSYQNRYSREIDASDVAALKKQQADFARQSQQQAMRSQAAIDALQQQLISQSVQTQLGQQQMQDDWNRQFTTFTQNTLAQTAFQAPLNRPQQGESVAAAATIPQPAPRQLNRQFSRKLSHIPTTYQVPKRTQVRWVDRLLSWVPKFLWLFFLGIALSVSCAIALQSSGLAPIGLLPSLSSSISSAVPYLFVISVVSLGITAVWDTFR